MKKTIVVMLALALAGPLAMQADPQDVLMGKVVRLSGAVNGMGVVLLYKPGYCMILDEIDGSKQQVFDLKNQEYELVVLAFNREAYLQMQVDGLTPAEITAEAKPVPTVSAFAYLSDIAEEARKGRIGAAIPCLITGGIVSTMGISLWALSGSSGEEIETVRALGQIALASGLFVLGVGAIHCSHKTSAERIYDQAQKLSDEERSAFCADALKKESRKAQTGRYISAGIYFGLAAAVLQWTFGRYEPEEYFLFTIPNVIGFGISALSKLIFPSYEEKMYRRYLEGKAIREQCNKLTLNIGPVPRGFALGVRYCFQ
jgi:hypothetical protein